MTHMTEKKGTNISVVVERIHHSFQHNNSINILRNINVLILFQTKK